MVLVECVGRAKRSIWIDALYTLCQGNLDQGTVTGTKDIFLVLGVCKNVVVGFVKTLVAMLHLDSVGAHLRSQVIRDRLGCAQLLMPSADGLKILALLGRLVANRLADIDDGVPEDALILHPLEVGRLAQL